MILDTNAYSALALAHPQMVSLAKDATDFKLPLPVIAELRFGFAKGSKPDYNEQMLQKFLAQPQVSVLIPSLQTTVRYAELHLWCQQHGRALSHNDIWIAALAQEADDILATFDQDFTVLNELLNDKLLIYSMHNL